MYVRGGLTGVAKEGQCGGVGGWVGIVSNLDFILIIILDVQRRRKTFS